MQNNVIMLGLTMVLRLLQRCAAQFRGMFVLRRGRAGRFGLGAFSLSVDLDSARLDAVSRSLLWGSGVPLPEPIPMAGCPPIARARDVRWHGGCARDVSPPRRVT